MIKGRAVTKEQKRWHDLLVNEVGCIACIGHGRINHHCSIHHCDGRTKPHAHWYVLPLCGLHHQTGPEGVAFHVNKFRFERRYGTQAELLQKCAMLLARGGHDIPAGFLAWLDGSEIEA